MELKFRLEEIKEKFRLEEVKEKSDDEEELLFILMTSTYDNYMSELNKANIPNELKKHFEDAFVYDVCFLLMIYF